MVSYPDSNVPALLPFPFRGLVHSHTPGNCSDVHLALTCSERLNVVLTGKVTKIRLLGDYHHSTRIAFVEFATPESAKAALHISGALLGKALVLTTFEHYDVKPELVLRIIRPPSRLLCHELHY